MGAQVQENLLFVDVYKCFSSCLSFLVTASSGRVNPNLIMVSKNVEELYCELDLLCIWDWENSF